MGNTTIIGGYHILDFRNAKLTSSYQTIPTIYDQLVKADKRAIVIANVSNGNVPIKETYVDVRLSGSNFILYAHALKITITPTSKVKIEADEIHQRVDKIEETLTPSGLLENLIEGSDYISVDENEDETKIKIELDETKVETAPIEDSDALITSGGVFDALAARPYRIIYKDGDAKLGPDNHSGINFKAGQNVNIVSAEDTAGNLTLTFNATGGGSGTTEIFWATRGTTTAAEVQEAVEQGKIVACYYSSYTYLMNYETAIYYYFTIPTSTGAKQISLRKADDFWSGVGTVKFQKELVAGTGITIDSNNVIGTKTLLAPYHNYIKVRFSIGEGARYRGMTMQFDVFSTVDYEAEQISTIEDLAELMYADQIRDIEIPCTGHNSLTNNYGTTGKCLPYATGIYAEDDVHRVWVKTCTLDGSGDLTDTAINIDNAYGATVSIKTQKIYD